MSDVNEPVAPPGVEDCILCHEKHKARKQNKLPEHTFQRSDDSLTSAGQAYIKNDPHLSRVYPKADDGNFVSPLVAAVWSADQIFNTYKSRSGKKRAYAEKYQAPPIHGYIAAPHHMVAVCCLNGDNGLPAKPKVNAWAHKGGYDINNGQNCIFLPSSASQFFVAYYYWKVRGTGQALQGHLGAHRKVYFETVWDHLERIARSIRAAGWCNATEGEEKIETLAETVIEEIHFLEDMLFQKLSALKPEDRYRLGAESWIEIPDEGASFHVPADVTANLQPYEILPLWY